MSGERLAILGMASCFDECASLAELERATYTGALPAGGARLEVTGASLIDRLIEDALVDAGLASSYRSTIARVVIDDDASGLARALDGATDALASNDAVALVGVSEIARCGGAAIVLVRAGSDLARRGAYASVIAAAIADDLERAARAAFAQATVADDDIAYVDVWSAAQLEREDVRALLASHPPASETPTCAIAGGGAVLGACSASARYAVSLVRAAIAIHHGYVPGIVGWSGPREGASLRGSRFYVAEAATPWFASPARPSRIAAVASIERSGATYAVLCDADVRRRQPIYSAVAPLHVVPFEGDRAAALEALAAWEESLAGGGEPARLATSAHAAVRAARDRGGAAASACGVALVGRDASELAQEIAAVRRGLSRAGDVEVQTPRGSCFVPRPLGPRGGLAFVYPGAFSAYPGMMRDVFRAFPSLFAGTGAWPADVGKALAERAIYPRFAEPPDAAERAVFEARLQASPAEMISSGTLASIAYTRIARDVFGLRPAAAFGYSLGEATMCWALGAWNDGDAGAEDVRTSPIFRTRLGGSCEALREFWRRRGRLDLAARAAWSSHVLVASAADVTSALASRTHDDVFLVAINAPSEVVIAGEPDACARFVAALGCEQVPMPVPLLLHSDVLATEYDAFVDANTRETMRVHGIAFHSAIDASPFVPEREAMARRIARMVTQPLDFAALVVRVHDAGARIFLELGPNASCTRLIGANLRGREHAAIAIDRRGVDSRTSVIRAAARLFAHRVPIDLAPLY